LRSLTSGKRYIGYTAKAVQERLLDHHSGTNQWTRAHRPFEIIHCETYQDKKFAIQRERFLKSGSGRRWLDDNIPR